MSFTGDLEYLPIVDVLQLIHTSRKSGVLAVRGRKGESQLIFKEGDIVSASHLNNSVRIGKILVDQGAVTEESLDKALLEQQKAGDNRKPLIVTLVELGLAKEEDAYRSLEHLIEMTIVEILSWKKGSFTLDSKPAPATDGYRYSPERLQREISIDTQGALMDALRVYDEKMRDGLLDDDSDTAEEVVTDELADAMPHISADDLGLGDLDNLEERPRKHFTTITSVDPLHQQRLRLRELLADLPDAPIEQLATFLSEYHAKTVSSGLSALIVFSADELLCHCFSSICSQMGMFVCTVRESAQLAKVCERCAVLNSIPILLFDAPDPKDPLFTEERKEALSLLQQRKGSTFPLLQLAPAGDTTLAMNSYASGFKAVIPRPGSAVTSEEDAAELISFLENMVPFLCRCMQEQVNHPLLCLKTVLTRLLEQPTPQAVAAILLQQVADLGERALTMVVRGGELVTEKGIGATADRSEGIVASPAIRIPLKEGSLLSKVVNEGRTLTGALEEPLLGEYLFPLIGAPLHPGGILLPIRYRGRTLAVIYGDFGLFEANAINGDFLDILSAHANLVLDRGNKPAV